MPGGGCTYIWESCRGRLSLFLLSLHPTQQLDHPTILLLLLPDPIRPTRQWHHPALLEIIHTKNPFPPLFLIHIPILWIKGGPAPTIYKLKPSPLNIILKSRSLIKSILIKPVRTVTSSWLGLWKNLVGAILPFHHFHSDKSNFPEKTLISWIYSIILIQTASL